mgnify:CR=1 FL=1
MAGTIQDAVRQIVCSSTLESRSSDGYARLQRTPPPARTGSSRGRSTPLDPSLPIEAREITGRLLLDAGAEVDAPDQVEAAEEQDYEVLKAADRIFRRDDE